MIRRLMLTRYPSLVMGYVAIWAMRANGIGKDCGTVCRDLGATAWKV